MNIKGMNKAAILAALYNASRPLGMGFMHYDPKPMTDAEAADLLLQGTCFDYLKGRVMKIDLSGDELRTYLYNRDNGDGAAERALAALHIFGSPVNSEIEAFHRKGTGEALEKAEDAMAKSTTVERKDGYSVVRLGLSDAAEDLRPALKRARGN